MSLASALERAAVALPADEDDIRPANGDPLRLLETLSPDAAGRVLAWLLAEAPGEVDDLVDTWEQEEAGVAVILGIEEAELPKPGRKALRRVRHRLRSRGVELPKTTPKRVVAALPSLEDRFDAALVTAPDPMGARLVYLVEPDPSGGGRLFEITLDDLRGVLGLEVFRAGRSRIRAFLRAVGGRSRFAAVEADPAAVRTLVGRVLARQAPEQRAPAELSEWRSHIAATDTDTPAPGDEVAAALPCEDADAERRAALDCIQDGRIGPWPPPADQLEPVAASMRERAGSQMLVNAAQRREQAEAVLDESLEALFAPAVAEGLADRFREAAFVLWKGGDETEARACLAAARSFAEEAPADNPIARAILVATFTPLLESLEQDAETPPASDAGA